MCRCSATLYICIFICIFIHLNIYIYIYMYVCMCGCVYKECTVIVYILLCIRSNQIFSVTDGIQLVANGSIWSISSPGAHFTNDFAIMTEMCWYCTFDFHANFNKVITTAIYTLNDRWIVLVCAICIAIWLPAVPFRQNKFSMWCEVRIKKLIWWVNFVEWSPENGSNPKETCNDPKVDKGIDICASSWCHISLGERSYRNGGCFKLHGISFV